MPVIPGVKLSVFVGRDEELDFLLEAFSRVEKTGLVSVLVHAASGVGKTALMQVAGQKLQELMPQAMLLWGRCSERELVSFKAFDSVVEALGQNLAQLSEPERFRLLPENLNSLVRVFPSLAFLQPADAPEPDAPASGNLRKERALAFDALWELLARLADRKPLVLFLDDIQWADPDSFRLLQSLVAPPDPPALFAVFSMRTRTDEHKAAEMVRHFETSFPGIRKLGLGPLSREASENLVKNLRATNPELEDLAPEEVGIIVREAGGHPLFIHELMHHLQLYGTEGLQGLKLDDVLWARIWALEEPFRQLVELVSLSFGPLRQDIAAEVLECRPAEVFRKAARLRILRLVRTSGPGPRDVLEPYHDKIRSSVMGHMDPAAGAKWHAALVTVLRTRRDVEDERMAAHLESLGEYQEAANFLVASADRAAGMLAFDRAAGLYERALMCQQASGTAIDGEWIRNVKTLMGNALANSGHGKEAARILLEASEGGRTAEVLELKRKATEQLLVTGYLDEGFDLTRKVFRSMGIRLPRTSLGALLSLGWHRFWFRLRGIRYRERDETELSPVALVNVDILGSIARGLALTDHIRGADFSTRYLLAALRTGEPRRILAALTLEANFVASTSPGSAQLTRVLAHCERLLVRLNDSFSRVYLESARSYVNYMSGRWAEARRFAETAIDLWSEFGGTSWERGMMSFQVHWALYFLGEISEMTRLMPPLLQDARERGDLLTMSGLVLGLNNIMILNRDGPEQARQEVDDLMERWSVHGYYLQNYLALLAKGHVLLFEGQGYAACRLIENDSRRLRRSLLLRIPSVRHESVHLAGRARLQAALQVKGTQRAELHKAASRDIAVLRNGSLDWVRAAGMLLDGARHSQNGALEMAVPILREAIETLDFCQMRLFAAAARIRLGRLMGGDEGKELQDEGQAFFLEQGIRSETGMLELLTSGFPEW